MENANFPGVNTNAIVSSKILAKLFTDKQLVEKLVKHVLVVTIECFAWDYKAIVLAKTKFDLYKLIEQNERSI